MTQKQLIITEKPSVAKDLSRVLQATTKHKHYYEGATVIVTWALGHLLGLKMPEDLCKEWQSWQLDTLPMLPENLGIKPLPKTMPQLKAIQQLAGRKDIKEAVIATDAGREGELVARWILEYVRFQKPVKRLWISSQTDQAIRQGFQQLKPMRAYDALYESALARAKADWFVGLNVSRALTVKYQDQLSAGRVQTPTLAFVFQQEEKVAQFRPKTFYSVGVTYQQQKGRYKHTNNTWQTHAEAEAFVQPLMQQKGRVTDIQEKPQVQQAPLPYDLTELQREANHLYQFSAKKTLSIIQALYETHKLVTYPRTDSRYLTSDMKQTMAARLQAIARYAPEALTYVKSGGQVLQKSVFNDQKVTDHHALIPTEQMPKIEKLSADEQKIYRMIVTRFLGLFAGAHQALQVTVTVHFGEVPFVFQETKTIVSGWKKEPVEQSKGNWQLGMQISGHFAIQKELTSPPKLLNEGHLLGQMEKYGLGTPATRAEIIEKLIKSELMVRTPQGLSVLPKGKQLLHLVNPSLVTPELTKKWERALEKIAQGQQKSQHFLTEIKEDTRKLVQEIKQSEKKYQDFAVTQKKCPECEAFLRIKQTRDGAFYVCTSAACSYRRRKDPKVSNRRCTQCHRKMVILEGKNGTYFKCTTCSFSEKMNSQQKKAKKVSKREEKQLLKKYSQQQAPQESALAQALQAAFAEQTE